MSIVVSLSAVSTTVFFILLYGCTVVQDQCTIVALYYCITILPVYPNTGVGDELLHLQSAAVRLCVSVAHSPVTFIVFQLPKNIYRNFLRPLDRNPSRHP